MPRPIAPTLAEMTAKAIQILAQNPKGFFVMVEGGQIDWASHDNDAANTIADTVAFDAAVAVAREFAAKVPDTLIIVTADHETGGLALSRAPTGKRGEQGPFSIPGGAAFYAHFPTDGHTPVDVPLTAEGPLAERLAGRHDNTHLYHVMREALQ